MPPAEPRAAAFEKLLSVMTGILLIIPLLPQLSSSAVGPRLSVLEGQRACY